MGKIFELNFKKILFCLLISVATAYGSSGLIIRTDEIITTPSLKELCTLAFNVDTSTLACFDCDKVVQQYVDPGVGPMLFEALREQIPVDKEFCEAISIVFKDAPIRPVDPRLSHIIKIFQISGAKTLCLTQCGTGRLGLIASMINWRITSLQSLDCYFGASWPASPEEHLFTELDTGKPRFIPTSTIPSYKEGVACACDVDKGIFLIEVLKYLEFVPKRIIYIDDSLPQVQSVQKAAATLGVHFTGIHYTAASLDKRIPDIDVRQKQIDLLRERHMWGSEVAIQTSIALQRLIQQHKPTSMFSLDYPILVHNRCDA